MFHALWKQNRIWNLEIPLLVVGSAKMPCPAKNSGNMPMESAKGSKMASVVVSLKLLSTNAKTCRKAGLSGRRRAKSKDFTPHGPRRLQPYAPAFSGLLSSLIEHPCDADASSGHFVFAKQLSQGV